MKGIIKKLQGKIAMSWRTLCQWGLVLMAVVLASVPSPVLAASTEYVKPLTNLKDIILTLVEAVGGIIFAAAIPVFAYFAKNDNQNGEYNAAKIGIAGAICCAASLIFDIVTG